jgi:hypothetical protein
MQEVLSRSRDSSQLADGEEFIELRLSDIGQYEEYPSFWVVETVSQWDAMTKKLISAEPQLHSFESLDAARLWYEDRRRFLVDHGFAYSDMDW